MTMTRAMNWYSTFWLAAASIAGLGVSSAANAQIADTCSDILQSSSRDFSQTAFQSITAVRVYNQYCQQDQARANQSNAIGLSAILDEVPIKFTSNSSSGSERLSNFCKTFDQDYKQNQTYYQNLSTVNDNTTDAWLSCKKLAQQGVGFSTAVSRQQLLVSVKQLHSDPVSVLGVSYDPSAAAMTCTAPNSDASPRAAVKVDSKTTKSLNASFWTVTCSRTGIKDGPNLRYPPATISVTTTAGPFLFTAPGDEAFNLQYAADIQTRLAALSNLEQAEKSDLSALRNRLATTPQSTPAANVNFGGGANPMGTQLRCPGDQVMTGIDVVAGGTCNSQCNPDGRPIHTIQIVCAPRISQ